MTTRPCWRLSWLTWHAKKNIETLIKKKKYSFRNLESGSFASFIPFARIYFDINATKEMLAEWRPIMCPFDVSMSKALERFSLFIPSILFEHEFEFGYKLAINFVLIKNILTKNINYILNQGSGLTSSWTSGQFCSDTFGNPLV